MRAGRALRLAAAATVAAAVAGCGLGPGPGGEGEATLTVTRDYGAEPMLEATAGDPSASETVMRLLDREAEITTRYGGRFVQSIDGVEGELSDGRSSDWFFFVNGIESSLGAADVQVSGGDRIWWDYRDWTDALRTPAVVGAWPEPFEQAAAEEELPVLVECRGERDPCDAVSDRLAEEGVEAAVEPGRAGSGAARESLRLIVGPWAAVRDDPVAHQLDQGPATSGVFARFEHTAGGYRLLALDQRAAPADRLGPGAGLVAGLRRGEEPASWLVTGTDPAGVEAAVGLLDDEHLADRYAVAGAGDDDLPLPAPPG